MRFIFATLVLCASATAFATTATVFTPDVNEGDRSFEYRASYVPDSGLDADVFFQRLHFQYAFDDSWRARLVVNHLSVDGESLDYRSSRLEVQWQYREDQKHGWDAALRFDVEVGDESPDQVRLLWTVQRNFAERWQIRGNVALGRVWRQRRAWRFAGDQRAAHLWAGRRQTSRHRNVQWLQFDRERRQLRPAGA